MSWELDCTGERPCDLMPQGKTKGHVAASIQEYPNDAHLYICPSHIESGWPVYTVEYGSVWFLRLGSKRHCSFVFFVLGSFTLGKSAAISWGNSSSPMKMSTWEGTLPTASTSMPAMRLSHLAVNPPVPLKPLMTTGQADVLSQTQETPQARISYISYPSIPDHRNYMI